MLKIVEMFHSIQGEGVLVGKPTTFIRLAGCNLRCEWCDTKYALDPESGKDMDIEGIISFWSQKKLPEVCITGGEPLLQDIKPLIEAFLNLGVHVTVETNGSLDISDILLDGVCVSMDYKLPSSGMMNMMRTENISLLRPEDQIKFVIGSEEDFSTAVNTIKDHDISAAIVFQNVYGTMEMSEIVSMILSLCDSIDCSNVRFIPQIHKFIWPPDMRGV